MTQEPLVREAEVAAFRDAVLTKLTYAVGSMSGRTSDKFERFAVRTETSPVLKLPVLSSGCSAWLECRLLPEPHNQQVYDLFIGEVTAAWADDRVFRNGHWEFDTAPVHLRTLHYVAGGQFYATGQSIKV